jgi:1,4-dihydroxy-2-naphthoate polyprenyltransferase
MTSQESVRPPEPTASAFATGSASARLKRLFLPTRPAFFPASAAPVIVGSAWGYRIAHQFDWVVFGLALIATLCVHFASNVLNDVGDELSGTDRINEERIFPYTGGSRFIQNGILSAKEMARLGVALLSVAMLLGFALIDLRGPAILIFGITGIALGLLYSLPPLQLAGRGVGEAAIAVAFGALPVTGAAWLQSGRVDWQSVLISIPVSLWVAGILLMNEVPDRNADAQVGKRTLVVRFGLDGTRGLYLGLHTVACAAFLLAGLLGLLPWWMGVVALILLPGAWRASRGIREGGDRGALTKSIEMTLKLHTAGSALLTVAVLLAAR